MALYQKTNVIRSTIYSCNMGMPKAQGLRAYISDKSRVLMLQLICNTSIQADSLDANTSVTTGFILYACLKDSIIVRQQVTL